MPELFFCPLECGAHISSLYKHLTKCKKKHLLGTEYLKCPYNSTHIIHHNLYALHLLSCEDRPQIKENESDDSIKLNISDESDSNEETEIEKDKSNEEVKKTKPNNKNTFTTLPKKTKKNKFCIKYKTTYDKEEDVDEESKEFYTKVYIL